MVWCKSVYRHESLSQSLEVHGEICLPWLQRGFRGVWRRKHSNIKPRFALFGKTFWCKSAWTGKFHCGHFFTLGYTSHFLTNSTTIILWVTVDSRFLPHTGRFSIFTLTPSQKSSFQGTHVKKQCNFFIKKHAQPALNCVMMCCAIPTFFYCSTSCLCGQYERRSKSPDIIFWPFRLVFPVKTGEYGRLTLGDLRALLSHNLFLL